STRSCRATSSSCTSPRSRSRGRGAWSGPQRGELVRDLQLPPPEAVEGGGAAARRAGLAACAGRLEHPPAEEHALEVRRRDLVAERRAVEVAELRDRERRGCEREPDVRVRELAAQPLAGREHDAVVVEGEHRQVVDSVPARVRGEGGVGVARDEAEVGGRELAPRRVALRVAQRLELLEVRELADVDLRGEVAADRGLERLGGAELAARERPAAGARVERPLPQEHLEAAAAHAEDGGEDGVGGRACFRPGIGNRVHSGDRLSPLRRKPHIVVVGGGVAGLYAALCAAAEAEVLLLAKTPVAASASWRAQGGVAAAVAPDDAPSLHAEDTFRAGRGLCRPGAVEVLVEDAPARVEDLARLGVPFDPDLGREGGHSRRRIAHVGGAETGRAIAGALAERVRAHPRIEVAEERVRALLEAGGRCAGVVTDRRSVRAAATLLATGGYAALWARTTNPPGAVGEGLALAYRAGAALADLELVQFHPTAPAESGFLLSEALRGEGALLVDED